MDLEIESSGPLEVLIKEMGTAVYVLHSGPGTKTKHFLSLECFRSMGSADETANALCRVVERLSVRGRRVWDRAKHKRFDVGYELPKGAFSIHDSLKRKTLERIVSLGGTLAFSFYSSDNNDTHS